MRYVLHFLLICALALSSMGHEALAKDAPTIVERFSKDATTLRWLLGNPEMPAAQIRDLADDPGYSEAIALNPNAPADVLAAYVDAYQKGKSGLTSDLILQTVPCNPNTSAATLEKIWDIGYEGSIYYNPMSCILRNPNTPEWILKEVFPADGYISKQKRDDDIITYSGSVLISIAPSDAYLIAADIAHNPNAPQSLLAKTNLSAVNPFASTRLLAKLADDQYNEIRILVGGNLSTPADTLAKLAADDDWWVRAQVAGNPNTPVRTLYELYAHADEKILRGTWHRHWQYELRYGLAGNPRTPLYILEELAKSTDTWTLSALATNPKLPERMFESLLEGPDDSYMPVKQSLARNPKSPLSVLEKLAASENSQIRSMVAANPATPYSLLDTLSRDSELGVRQEVAKNPNIFASGN